MRVAARGGLDVIGPRKDSLAWISSTVLNCCRNKLIPSKFSVSNSSKSESDRSCRNMRCTRDRRRDRCVERREPACPGTGSTGRKACPSKTMHKFVARRGEAECRSSVVDGRRLADPNESRWPLVSKRCRGFPAQCRTAWTRRDC